MTTSWLRAQRRSALLATAALLLGMGISTDMARLPVQPGSGPGGPVPVDGGGMRDWVLPPHSEPVPPGTGAVALSTSGERPSTVSVAAGSVSIPARVLSAYRSAAAAARRSDPGCGLQWPLLAAIGQVESGHARGGAVRPDGRTLAPILGPVLSGGPDVAAIRDTDGGRYDGDRVWDRAVGPMQFIPSSWALFGRDGDGDGVADPSDVDDAASATAGYLCRYGDLGDQEAVRRAVFGYNHSWDYVAVVLAWAKAYAGGQVAPTTGRTTLVAFSAQGGQGRPGGPGGRSARRPSASGPPGSSPSPTPRGGPTHTSGGQPGSGPAPPGTLTGAPPSSGPGSPSSSPTGSPSPSPTGTASPCPTGSPTPTGTGSPRPMPTEPTPSPTVPTPTPTPTGTGCPTADPASTPSPSGSAVTPTPRP